jgi:hypothetical protein
MFDNDDIDPSLEGCKVATPPGTPPISRIYFNPNWVMDRTFPGKLITPEYNDVMFLGIVYDYTVRPEVELMLDRQVQFLSQPTSDGQEILLPTYNRGDVALRISHASSRELASQKFNLIGSSIGDTAAGDSGSPWVLTRSVQDPLGPMVVAAVHSGPKMGYPLAKAKRWIERTFPGEFQWTEDAPNSPRGSPRGRSPRERSPRAAPRAPPRGQRAVYLGFVNVDLYRGAPDNKQYLTIRIDHLNVQDRRELGVDGFQFRIRSDFVAENDAVNQMRQKMCEILRFPLERIALVWEGRTMVNDMSLESQGITLPGRLQMRQGTATLKFVFQLQRT